MGPRRTSLRPFLYVRPTRGGGGDYHGPNGPRNDGGRVPGAGGIPPRRSFRLLQRPDSGGDAFKPVFGAPRQVIKVNNAIAAEIRVQTVACVQPV